MNNKMTKREFCEYIKENIVNVMPMDLKDGVISVVEVQKNNFLATGISIMQPQMIIAPTIYIEHSYERYENGDSIQDIMTEFVSAYVKSLGEIKTMDVDINEIYSKPIIARLTRKGSPLVSDKPHRDFLDLSIYYAFEVCENGLANITNAHLEDMGITEEVLFEKAMDNMPHSISLMGEIMCEIGQLSQEELSLINDVENPMYVVSTQSKSNGAAVIFKEEVMEQLSAICKGDVVLLPFSVHEWIAIPSYAVANASSDVSGLFDMVSEVNETLEPTEILSNNVYYYASKEKELRVLSRRSVIAVG